jgi:hypothetical protein
VVLQQQQQQQQQSQGVPVQLEGGHSRRQGVVPLPLAPSSWSDHQQQQQQQEQQQQQQREQWLLTWRHQEG